ncbi:energy-coupling factor ABC transporter ATP-binding protein [Halogranum rubrum]|uniref:Cobalt ABC transporter ATP-binding protein n=1 Tax=Halogranum salarium B-1 TaxID=1210908 RepID=J3JE74_9EURY|nr:energy-coupling factor ABC transporter ATP-binding protein [Halogranum salarium]EJN58121.1 cobalt ABC transporter ATP-binding protein [Halogranum salarium B-1]
MSDPAIDARDVTYRHPDGTVAVDGVDLRVEPGSRVALLGANGAGKSTLLQLLGGLLDPSEGTVRWFGERDADSVRDRLSVLLQDADDYLFNPTVREDLAYGPRQLRLPANEVDERVATLAARFDLEPLLDRPPFRLSGGEKRRAAFAAALSLDPEALLLDEPVSHLDAQNRRRILDVLDELAAEGVTTVVATPDPDLVPAVADRVCLLGPSGTVVADGTPREILTDRERLRAAGLRPPTLVRLFGDLDGVDGEDVPVSLSEADALLRRWRETE